MVKAFAHSPRGPGFESRPTMWIELVVSSPMPSARKQTFQNYDSVYTDTVNKNHDANSQRYTINTDHNHHRLYKHHWHHYNRQYQHQYHHHHHQHHYLCQAVKSSVDSNPELLQTEHMSFHVIQALIRAYHWGGFRSWPSGPRALLFFLRNFVLLFQKILSRIHRTYSAGKCPGHPFLNFLDPPLLIVLRTTRPWVSIQGKKWTSQGAKS